MSGTVDEGAPIKSGALLKWGMAIGTLCAAVVSIVLWLSAINTHLATHDEKIETLKTNLATVDANSISRDGRIEKDIEEQKTRQNASEERYQKMDLKLDHALTILERLDAKAGRP